MKTRLFILVVVVFTLSVALPMILSPETSAQGGTAVHFISTQGTLPASGQYSQSFGEFIRFVQGTPTPTPSPMPTPTATPCVPIPGDPGGTLYLGSYTLSNGESGSFLLSVQVGTNAATGTGVSPNLPPNPVVAQQGPATVNLQINIQAGTGSGTISFTSNGTAITGNIVITNKFPYPPSDPVTCGTPTPTPAGSPTPTPAGSPTPTASPTPSTVEVSGRVLTPTGLGLRNAVVSLTDSLNVRRAVTTSSFGTYRFENVRTNEVYILAAASKRFRFAPQVLLLTGPMLNFDLVGLE